MVTFLFASFTRSSYFGKLIILIAIILIIIITTTVEVTVPDLVLTVYLYFNINS